MGSIVVVGSSNTDMILRVPHLPAPGETVLGGTFHRAAGGKGANQAVAAARAGGTVSFVACLGTDDLGDETLRALQDEGIDTRAVRRDTEAPSGVALIFVDDDGENCIAVAPGANGRLLPRHIDDARELLEAADVVVVQMEIPLETVRAVAEAAREAATPLVLNPAPARPLPDDLLADVSVLTPNQDELFVLTGARPGAEPDVDRAADALLERGVGTVVVTRGADGALVVGGDGRLHISGFTVRAVDTTGAGDVFNGALAVALAEGKDTGEAVRFANAAAALSVTTLGAQPAIPRRGEILDLLADTLRPGPDHRS